jgi:peptide deformylase
MATTDRSAERAQRAERQAAARAQIRQYPDPVLRSEARAVEHFDDDLRALVERMIRLMHDANGAGLAAPQIGLLRRLFVYQADGESEPRALVNPEIVARSEETAVEGEGCLSLYTLIDEDVTVPVERALRVTVRAHDPEGQPVEFEAEGHEARVIQHESDHLDGKLIVDLDRAADADARREAMRILRH